MKTFPVFIVFLIVVLFLTPTPPSLAWVNIVPILLLEAVCVLGCSIFVASLAPFMPDISMLIPITIRMLFFGSGIFYNIEDVVLPQHQIILYSNPIAVCIKEMRTVLLYSQTPDWGLLAYAFMISLVILALGCALVFHCRAKYSRIINQ